MVLKKEISDQIKDLLQKNPQGLKIADIVKVIRINRNTAGRYLENFLVSGQVEMRHLGMAKIYKISQRVPLSAVLSISSELVVQLDSYLRIVFVNEPFCSLIGTDSKDLVGKNIEYSSAALIFDELFVGFIERIREGIAGQEWAGEIILHSKGIIVWCRIAPTVFEDGRRGVSIILEDVTRQKQGEWALRESEATARALMNSPTDTVILMDTRGIILDLNETAASRFKHQGKDLVGTLADTLLPKKVAQSRRVLTNQVIEKKQLVRYEDERDGRWYDTVAYPIIVDGEVTRIAMIARDITDRKKSEDALRESEERYRTLVEISPDAVIIHQEGKIMYLNPAALALFGAGHAHEFLGKNILDLIHPDYRGAVRENIRLDLDGKTSPPIELRMLRADGTSVIVEGRGVKTTINGKSAIQVAIRDISDRKRVELELRENEERLRLLLSSTEDLILMQDFNGHYLYFNASDKYGVSEEMVIGSTPFELFPEETAHRILERIKKVFRNGQTIAEETSVVWKGQTLWFSDTLSPVRDRNGTITAVVTISHNITERKLAELELRESEEKYRELVNRANDVICVIQDGIIKVCNPRLEEYWDGPLGKIVGRPFTDFVHQDTLAEVTERYHRRMAGETVPILYRTILKRKDGSRSHVELNAGSISYEGRPADLVIIRDINDRKRVEDALKKSEDMYRSIAETSNDLIFVIGRDDRVEYVNTFASALINMPADRIIGQPRTSLFPSEAADNQKKALDRVFETGIPVRTEGPLTFSGRTCWFDHYLIPLKDAHNNVGSVLGISRDITERKNIPGPHPKSE
jgi:PAS domain S-box-containing protein